jgi:alpha-tubulin suppressor-like RCC1 family protein
MIPIKSIVDTANNAINAGSLTDNQYTQIAGINTFISPKGNFNTVAALINLPPAANFKGVVFYVSSLSEYYFSNGISWENNFTSDNETIPQAYAWGPNSAGQLSDGTTTSRLSPVTVVGGITTWSQISAGGEHSLGLTTTGIAYAWGNNNQGRLGDNTTSNRSSPVTVVGEITNWSQLAAGSNHSLGATSSGIAYAWGQNTYGRLGDNTTSSRSSPVTVVGGITNWNQLATGSNHSLGRTSSGIAYAWGRNYGGPIGDNTTSNRSSPVTVVGGITTWSQLAGGSYHSLGRTSSGIAYAWGGNSYGHLGDNTTTARSSPVTVVGGITNWSQVSAGYRHSLAITLSGIAYAWGRNLDGVLGDNTTSSRRSPVTVVGGITNWSQLAAGSYHSLGRTTAGIAYGWGRGSNGRLGDNTTSSRSSPVTVVGGITTWSQLAASGNHSLGLAIIPLLKGF